MIRIASLRISGQSAGGPSAGGALSSQEPCGGCAAVHSARGGPPPPVALHPPAAPRADCSTLSARSRSVSSGHSRAPIVTSTGTVTSHNNLRGVKIKPATDGGVPSYI